MELRHLQRPGAGPLKLRKADLAYHAIKREIMLGMLAPETQLGEQTVALEFGCSQATVREALMRLQDDGLVTRRGYRGTVVSTTRSDEAIHMVDIRLYVETNAVRRLAEDANRVDRAALHEIVGDMGRARDAGDAYACSELDRDFHANLLEASALHGLVPVLRRCALHMHRYTVNARPEFFRDSRIDLQHEAILAAIGSGDPDGAETAVRDHILGVLGRWAPALVARLRGPGKLALIPCETGSDECPASSRLRR